MCFSLEVSIAAAVTVYSTVFILWKRNGPRDRFNAIFLAVFGSMQTVDALFWWLDSVEGLERCSSMNSTLTNIANTIICFEPTSCLIGRFYSEKRTLKKKPLIMTAAYIIFFTGFTKFAGYYGSGLLPGMNQYCSETYSCANVVGGHLVYSHGQNIGKDGYDCWKENVFFGDQVYEIPLILRVIFLFGMCYPYLHMKPLKAGFLQISVLSLTWLVGYFSSAHASIWCFANLFQIVFMLMDPYLFGGESVKQ